MTDNEIERAEKAIYKAVWGDGVIFCKKNELRPITPEEQNTLNELNCRRMINSHLVYGDTYLTSLYAMKDAMAINGGMTRVKEIYEEQLADFKKATVYYNVGTDSDGVSYNSIRWADEKPA